jgi:hypothetical protein
MLLQPAVLSLFREFHGHDRLALLGAGDVVGGLGHACGGSCEKDVRILELF